MCELRVRINVAYRFFSSFSKAHHTKISAVFTVVPSTIDPLLLNKVEAATECEEND
jgi:hypothetical protein